MCEEAEAGKEPVEIRGTPPLFVQVFILKGIKSRVLELRIVKDLEGEISELRILKELRAGCGRRPCIAVLRFDQETRVEPSVPG